MSFKMKMFVSDNVHLAFEKYERGVARLYFADYAGLAVAIPDGLRVYRDGDGRGGGGALVAPIGACFILSWEHHYDIFVHSDLFYRLRRQAQHAVHGPVSVAAKQAMVAGTSAETALAAQELAQLMAE